ncbi:hypothetical protein [Aestuariivivens sediminis]|uniref:hypothetical protein n=1 Tax=Aestuariivivens sediminis TaxID=2913557 RepID=UPI001F57D53E|nr:hypothetical protein [Aestuariivivens sediminis]
MQHPFYSFVIKTTILLAIVFGIHLALLNYLGYPLFADRIVLSYSVNLLLVIGVFGFLYVLRKKYKSQLGFLFLAGSVLKFAVFFILFYPFYKQDQVISKLEFASFFVPYLVGLVLETFSLGKWLNRIDEE